MTWAKWKVDEMKMCLCMCIYMCVHHLWWQRSGCERGGGEVQENKKEKKERRKKKMETETSCKVHYLQLHWVNPLKHLPTGKLISGSIFINRGNFTSPSSVPFFFFLFLFTFFLFTGLRGKSLIANAYPRLRRDRKGRRMNKNIEEGRYKWEGRGKEKLQLSMLSLSLSLSLCAANLLRRRRRGAQGIKGDPCLP